MSIATDVVAFKAANDLTITTKDTPNSIPPSVVGGNINSLADIVLTYYGQVFNVSNGTTVPNNASGADTDLYFRDNNPIQVYQKVAGAWVLKATLNLGIAFPNGPIIGLLTAINGFSVTITAGGWVISNTIYRKDTATALTLTAANATLGRYDLIYADTAGAILLLTGTAAVTPVIPTTPANSIVVDIAFVPASGSGQSPYLLYGNNTGATAVPVLITGTYDAVTGEANLSAFAIGSFPVVTVYDLNGLQSPVQYNNTTKKLVGGIPGESFTARFGT